MNPKKAGYKEVKFGRQLLAVKLELEVQCHEKIRVGEGGQLVDFSVKGIQIKVQRKAFVFQDLIGFQTLRNTISVRHIFAPYMIRREY